MCGNWEKEEGDDVSDGQEGGKKEEQRVIEWETKKGSKINKNEAGKRRE